MNTLPDKETIFHAAAEIEDSGARREYLERVCRGNQALHREIEELLEHDALVGSFLRQPAVEPPVLTASYEPLAERPGSQIGPYKLLQKIGEGGFGVVFMAEQERPVRRMVALKIIRPGMDSREVIARFESERQALALMDHPNIAKVLDAGATESGRPYFAMELVKGVPITEFCDKNHMPAKQRLKLFIDVCHAILHAHHKGVIHRDIKPSNVMITLHDGVPVVKVIDFGVAKATVQKLTERTLFTAYGQMIGTPAYMSPEQAEMSGLDIDTRSDIYSLGVLLYELLTGTTPLEIKRLRDAGYAEMQRLIREEEAPRPSTRLSSLGNTATILAGNRGTDPRQLARLLAGDLDWIVMKALEKDRNRRYGTPGNLAEDLERYLAGEAILARPPSLVYKLKKLTQRNRVAVLTAALVSLALVLGTAIATWQAVRADSARREAEHAHRDAEGARQEAEKARRATSASLYEALLGRAAAERSARAPGYRRTAWKHLREAIALDVAQSDTRRVQNEVLNCLPDFVGLDPVPAAYISLSDRQSGTGSGKYVVSRQTAQIVTVRGADDRVIGDVHSTVGSIHQLRISDDDRLLAAACEEGFHVWSLPDLTPLMTARGDSVHVVGIHPDGHLLVTFSQRREVELWSLHSHRLLARFDAPLAANRADFSADGKYLVIAQRDTGLLAWQVNGTPERCELAGHQGGVTGVVFSPDGRRLASVSKDRSVKLWDALSGKLVRKLAGHAKEVQSVDFSPDGQLLATGDWNGELRLWDPRTGNMLAKTYSLAGLIWRVRFDFRGRFLMASGSTGVQGWQCRREEDVVSLDAFHWRPGSGVRDVVVLPGAPGYACIRHVSGARAEIWRHDFGRPDQCLSKEAFFSRVLCLHVLADGRLLYPLTSKTVGAFDLTRGEPLGALTLPLRDYYVSPCGEWVAGREQESAHLPIRFYRAASQREEFRLPHDPGPIWCMAFSRDGRQLAVGYADGRLAIWKLDEVRARLSEFGIQTPSTVCKPSVAAFRGGGEEFAAAMAAERALLSGDETIRQITDLVGNLAAKGWSRQAIALFGEALDRRIGQSGKGDSLAQDVANGLAWLLISAPEEELRNPERALELAAMAVAGDENSYPFRGTLGIARYCANDYGGAIIDLERAMEMDPGESGNPFFGYYLSMARHRLGMHNEARAAFDHAAATSNKVANPEQLERIRAEAAALLGIKKDN